MRSSIIGKAPLNLPTDLACGHFWSENNKFMYVQLRRIILVMGLYMISGNIYSSIFTWLMAMMQIKLVQYFLFKREFVLYFFGLNKKPMLWNSEMMLISKTIWKSGITQPGCGGKPPDVESWAHANGQKCGNPKVWTRRQKWKYATSPPHLRHQPAAVFVNLIGCFMKYFF